MIWSDTRTSEADRGPEAPAPPKSTGGEPDYGLTMYFFLLPFVTSWSLL